MRRDSKGYSNKETVGTFLRALIPTLDLRTVLEAIAHFLILDGLMKFLQSHYVEKSTADLYHALISLEQSSQESAIQLANRAIHICKEY